MYSNSRNDVPRVAQRYGPIAIHTRRCASVLVVYVVFCVHVYSFAGLIRRMPPPTFSDTAITGRHSDTTILQLRAHCVRISWSIGSENRSDMCPLWESKQITGDCSIFNPVQLPHLLIYKTILSGIFSHAYFKRKVFFPTKLARKKSAAYYIRARTIVRQIR